MNMFQDSQRKSSICPSLCVLVQLANIIFSSCKETLLSTYKTASIHHNLPGTFPSVARVWCSDVWFCTTALHRRSPAGAVTGNYSISCTPLPSNNPPLHPLMYIVWHQRIGPALLCFCFCWQETTTGPLSPRPASATATHMYIVLCCTALTLPFFLLLFSLG